MSGPEAAAPPPRTPRGSIWIGPFVGVSQANRAINAAGGLLVAIGLMPLFPLLTGGVAGGLFMMAIALFPALTFILPGAWLLFRRTSLAAAIALAFLAVIVSAVAVGLFVTLQSGNLAIVGPTALSVGMVFGAIVYLCWRARAAARFLAPLKDTTVFD